MQYLILPLVILLFGCNSEPPTDDPDPIGGDFSGGYTNLMWAVGDHNLERVKALISAGIDNVNAQNKYGETALMQASSWVSFDNRSDLDIVKALISAGADVNAQNKSSMERQL